MHLWRGYLVHTIFATAQPAFIYFRYLSNQDYFSQTSRSWLALTAITWIYILTKITIPFFTNPLRHIPVPRGETFPFGHSFIRAKGPPTDILSRVVRNTPNDGLVCIWRMCYTRCEIIPTAPDQIMDILNTHSYDWEKPVPAKKILARVLGEGLINVEGNTHKAMRRSVAPAFSGRHIRDLVPLMYGKGLAFADTLAREAKASSTGALEMMHQMSRVTLDIIGAAGVGKDFNTIENDDDNLARLYAIITDTNKGPLLLFFLVFSLLPAGIIKHLYGTIYRRVAYAQDDLRTDVRAIMQEKKQIMKSEKGAQQKDIISIIMRSGDFSDDYLVNQLLTFLAAGHDTTASALTWTSWLLSLNPEMQTRLRDECNKHLANVDPTTIDASIFDAETMPYLHAVCNETLRLYPTVPATARHAVTPTTVRSQPVPKGTFALIAPWAINRHPALWGADADEYNPDRWLESESESKTNSTAATAATTGGAKSPHCLITFLHGPRSCIGQNFARTEMKCLLAAIIMRFRFEILDPNEKIEVGGFVTIKPKNGMRLILHDLKAEGTEKTQTQTQTQT